LEENIQWKGSGAMISKDKTYRTKNGKEVRIYATDGQGEQPIHGAVLEPNGWEPISWDANGFYFSSRNTSSFDLIEVKPKFRVERWVNIYSDPPKISYLYKSKPEALRFAGGGRIATKRIIIEGTEGEDDAE